MKFGKHRFWHATDLWDFWVGLVGWWGSGSGFFLITMDARVLVYTWDDSGRLLDNWGSLSAFSHLSFFLFLLAILLTAELGFGKPGFWYGMGWGGLALVIFDLTITWKQGSWHRTFWGFSGLFLDCWTSASLVPISLPFPFSFSFFSPPLPPHVRLHPYPASHYPSLDSSKQTAIKPLTGGPLRYEHVRCRAEHSPPPM